MAKISSSQKEAIKRWTDYYCVDSSTINTEVSNKSNRPRRNVEFPSGTVFLAATQSGDIDETVALLKQGADPNSCTADGLTAHHQCCIDGNLEMLRSLVEHGADVNAQDNEGWAPLHAAASCDQSEIVSFLLEHGADVSVVNSEGQVPQDLCDEDNECLVLLQNVVRDRNIDVDRVRTAERERMLEDAKIIREGGVPSCGETLKFGATPLHVACAKGYDDVVELLLEAGLDVNRPDDDGWTPLHAAAHWKQERACELLCDYGADFKATAKKGQTPLDVCDSEISEKVEELQKAQAKKVIKQSPLLQSNVAPPEVAPVTTAQSTPPSSTVHAAFERRTSVEDLRANADEPETKRRQKARRSRETRRVTQHVRMEDLQAAAGGTSTSPEVISDEDGLSLGRDSDTPKEAPSRDDPVEEVVIEVPPSTDAKPARVVVDTKNKRRPKRRSRTERRQTGGITAADVAGWEHSASEGEAECEPEPTPENNSSLGNGDADDSMELTNSPCLCASRLLQLEKQLESMFETFDKDRSRVGALEKELKQVREENRALIRVIAKLSRS